MTHTVKNPFLFYIISVSEYQIKSMILSGIIDQTISCSRESNISELKNSFIEISRPSQNFLIVVIETSFLEESNIL